jgi:plastocyanin
MTRYPRAAIALFGIAAILSACASSGTPAPATAAGAASAGAAIEMSGFAFSKTAVEVAKGSAVTWTNKDGTTHTVSSGTPPTTDGKFDGQVAAGSTFSFTFKDAGTFKYFCAIHNTMTGTITVK